MLKAVGGERMSREPNEKERSIVTSYAHARNKSSIHIADIKCFAVDSFFLLRLFRSKSFLKLFRIPHFSSIFLVKML